MSANNNELHVVLGTGPLGKAVMRELLRQGKAVRMVNRSGQSGVPAGVQVVKADLYNSASLCEAVQGATIIYQCAQPGYTEWAEKFPPLQATVIEGAAAVGAKLVVAENLYAYGRVSGPITEQTPFQAHTRKGQVRAKMAEDLMAAHRAGKLQATAGRASSFYGPEAGQQGAFGDRIIPPMLAGKKVSGLGNLDLPHTYSYIDDYGRGLVVLGAHPEAYGQAWHTPNAPTLTTRQMLTLFFEEAGLPPKMGSVPNFMVQALGLVNPLIREVGEMLYEFNEPFVVDSSKFVKAFGDLATPHRQAVQQTLAWYKNRANLA